MDDTLENMRCLGSEWVNTAHYFLQGSARYLWKSVTGSRTTSLFNDLATFRRLFSKNFLSPRYQLRKRHEFLDFRQGNLSITEFDCIFRRLARHHEGTYRNQRAMMIQLHIAMNHDFCELLAP
ncbi:hypothetical protein ACFXTO_006417 [Malus domestica]